MSDIPTEMVIAVGLAMSAWLVGAGWAIGRRRVVEQRRQLAMVLGDRAAFDARHERLIRERLAGARVLSRPRFGGLGARLEAAGIDTSPRDFVTIEGVVAAIAAIGAGASFGPIGALGGGLAGLFLPYHLMRRRHAARLSHVNAQLPDLLQVLAGGLQAGQSFLQALDHAAGELGEPLRTELRVMLREIELGVSVEDALAGLRHRVPDADLALVIDAVMIQRRVGGNLGEVLSNIATTIRERIRIRGEVSSLTGQARLSGWVLSGLPVALAGGLVFMNPDYMAPLFTTVLGRLLLLGGVVSEALGIIVIRRIANVQV